MSSDDWNIKFDELGITKTIGKGNFGKVYEGTYLGMPVAIKQLYYVDDEDMQKYISREMATLKGLRHPNIVQLLGLCKDSSGIYIVTEYINGGDLKQKLKNPKIVMPWKLRIRIAIDVAYAMNYLHSKAMIHRDLKSQNLLVCDDWKIKICDFGFARRAKAKPEYLTMCGTDEWMAPEVGLGEKYDTRADVFSYGMVLCELITRKKPPRRQPGRAYAFPVDEFKLRVPADCPEGLVKLVLDCSQFYPERRPTFNDIIARLNEERSKLKDEKDEVQGPGELNYESSSSSYESDEEGGSSEDDEGSSEDEQGVPEVKEAVSKGNNNNRNNNQNSNKRIKEEEEEDDDDGLYSYGGVEVEEH